jgi:hypothetical protein
MRSLLIAAILLGSGCLLAAQAAGPVPPATVRQVKVLADRAPDCSTLKTIAESVTRDCQSNDEKAIAVYNFMRITHFNRPYPTEPGGVCTLKEINVYGWSLCGGLHSIQSSIWRELGWDWRFVGWSGHTTVEARYDDAWHYFDVFMKYYGWRPDPKAPNGRTVAGEDDLAADAQNLVLKSVAHDAKRGAYYATNDPLAVINGKANWTAMAFVTQGDKIEDIDSGLKTRKVSGRAEGWMNINHATGDYSTDINLAPGFRLVQTWELLEGGWYWGDQKAPPSSTAKDYRNSPQSGPILEPYSQPSDRRITGSGRLVFAPDFASAAILQSFAATDNVKCDGGKLVPAQAGKPASVTVRLQSPYVLCKTTCEAAGADAVEVSVDGGKSFKAADAKDLTPAVRGSYDALVRIGVREALTSLRIESLLQINKCATPYLSPGSNTITVSVADAKELGDNKVVVTYAYCTGSREKSYEELIQSGKEIAKGHFASWSSTPTVVQKVFTAKELPAKFDILIPTPKGKYPVYPKMLFLAREVIAPDGKPLALPEGAVAPKLGPDDELKTLPNPFRMGFALPAKGN